MKNALISAVAAVALTAALLPGSADARPSGGRHGGGGHHWSGGHHWNGGHVARGWRGHGYRRYGGYRHYGGPGIAFGFAAPYAYAYGGSCYRGRRVLTPWGWRFRRVWVC